MLEETSGTGYQRRPIRWTVVQSPVFVEDLVKLQLEGEADAIAGVLRRFTAALDPGPFGDSTQDMLDR